MEQHEFGSENDLAIYRLERAKTDLQSARVLFDVAEYRGANNRAYYAIYHAITAVHALDGRAYKRHKDALANFNKDYIRTEIFPKVMGRKISEAQEIRHASDYDDFYIATKAEALEQIETAEKLISLIDRYCRQRIGAEF
ncbi:MAG: HEPN domain-containing protein [Firmicutes bacterium]|nr:HEPN domain-containing protein [Bacillota bacterium]